MAKAMDLTGQRFGKLVVQYRSNQVGEKPIWHCICDCGNECNVSASNLRRGNTKSCGCLKKPNLIGQQFGLWTVINEAGWNGYCSQWLCRCNCGTERVVSEKSLKTGTSKSCGCAKIKYTEDYTGQKFGQWTVLERGIKGHSFWVCQCSCGTVREVNIADLLKGYESCNECRMKSRVDLTGQKFGKLIAESINWEITKEKNRQITYWNCRCECGNNIVVPTNRLRAGEKTSCGCSRMYSKGEKKIQECLSELNYKFISQKTFPDLFGEHNLLRFDFYLPEVNIVIEYQGIQHYKAVKAWEHGNNFETRQRYDKKKKEYCIKNNIKLIEIPYWELNQINKEYLSNKI